MSLNEFVLEKYKARVVRELSPYVPNMNAKSVEDFMIGVFILHTILTWRLSRWIHDSFPRSVQAVRSLVLSALFVILFWLVYLF
jgi:hypothetical protein